MLQLTDIVKTFPQPEGGRLTVLKLPRFHLAAGEQVALVGKSGGGKSTLLHIIAGIVTPDSGSVSLDGIELTKLSQSGRDRIRAACVGYVFQTFNLLAGLTALENVRLGMTFARGVMISFVRKICCSVWDSGIDCIIGQVNCPWDNNNGWPSRGL